MALKTTTDIQSVDDYIASQPPAVRSTLESVRNTTRKAVPQADEVISYKMPAYQISAGPVLYFAGWKHHYSLYPASGELVAAFQDKLAPYVVSKGTIRFPIAGAVPVQLIGAIAKFRAKEVAERIKVQGGPPWKRQPHSVAPTDLVPSLPFCVGERARWKHTRASF
jgi:uncharacterized protein YdhG (YjbR/CyaY superfamily)